MVTPRMSVWANDSRSDDAWSNEAPTTPEVLAPMNAAMAVALLLCVEALEAVEWIPIQDGDWVYCEWCRAEWYAYKPSKWEHKDDCLRQRALAAAKG